MLPAHEKHRQRYNPSVTSFWTSSVCPIFCVCNWYSTLQWVERWRTGLLPTEGVDRSLKWLSLGELPAQAGPAPFFREGESLSTSLGHMLFLVFDRVLMCLLLAWNSLCSRGAGTTGVHHCVWFMWYWITPRASLMKVKGNTDEL